MLNKKEKIVMRIIYDKTANKRKATIVTEDEIFDEIPERAKISRDQMNEILQKLALDDYFELIRSEKRGQPVLVITLAKNGEAFEREVEKDKRNLHQKLVITVICAIITAVVGVIIRAILM